MDNEIKTKSFKAKLKNTLEMIGISILMILLLMLVLGAVTYFSDSKKETIYAKDGIEVLYEEYNDYIEVKNNTDNNISIVIGDNQYSIADTNDKYTKIGINSNYERVYIEVNSAKVEINYEIKKEK